MPGELWPAPPPYGYVRCNVPNGRPEFMAPGTTVQVSHLVHSHKSSDTVCGLTRFGHDADIGSWAMHNGGVGGPGIRQENCEECWNEALLPVDESVTEYTFSLSFDASSRILVSHTGLGMWKVQRRSQVLSVAGDWEYEPIPSERTTEWMIEHRFTLEQALERARAETRRVHVNGLTARGIVEAWPPAAEAAAIVKDRKL